MSQNKKLDSTCYVPFNGTIENFLTLLESIQPDQKYYNKDTGNVVYEKSNKIVAEFRITGKLQKLNGEIKVGEGYVINDLRILTENKIKLSTDPKYYGATVGNYRPSGKVVQIPLDTLTTFEPEKKKSSAEAKKKIQNLVAAIKNNKTIPPILVRKFKSGYQVIDGHHRFWASQLANKDSISAYIVPAADIEAQKQLKEFAPPSNDGDDDGFSEETLKMLAAQWWNGDEDPRVEQTLAAAGWEIGHDEGYDNGGVFVVRSGDEHGRSYLSWPAEELESLSEATGDAKFDAMMSNIVKGAAARRDVDTLRAQPAKVSPQATLAKFGMELISQLEKLCQARCGPNRTMQDKSDIEPKLTAMANSDDGGEKVANILLDLYKIDSGALKEFARAFNQYGDWPWQNFATAWTQGQWSDYKRQWTDGYLGSLGQSVTEVSLPEDSTTLQRSRDTSQTMKTARNIDYSPALQKNVEAVIRAAHQQLQLPHDLNWMYLPPLDGLAGMNIFTDENLRKIWAYHRDPNQYTGPTADKNKLASLAFFIKGPAGAVVMIATPDYNMQIPRKFEMSAAYINLGDGTLETVRDVTKTKILPVIKAATGKVNVRSGEILVADIRQKHTNKITQRQQRRQETDKNSISDGSVYVFKKIYRLVPRMLKQVEADLMGMAQTLVKNKAYEKAKRKLEILDSIKNLENNITADTTNYYLMKASNLALHLTASHMFPEETGEISRIYSGYEVENRKGLNNVVSLIANGDRLTLGIFLAFFKRSLLLQA